MTFIVQHKDWKVLGIVTAGFLLTACEGSNTQIVHETATKTEVDHSIIVTGNGVDNNITLAGASRNGATFTFPKVTISQPGFLVMHPFRDSKPVQTEYVGAVPVSGTQESVSIEVSPAPATGDNYIVMLHYDMNEDGIFDFNDGVTVPDAPVFEGSTLVALRYVTPASNN